MTTMIVKIKKLNENAVIPFKKHPIEDACYDLIPVSCEYDKMRDRFIYHLGFATEFSSDWEAEIRPRSSNTKTDAYIPNGPGTIDSGYRGEWLVIYKLRTPVDQLFSDGDRELNLLCINLSTKWKPTVSLKTKKVCIQVSINSLYAVV